MRSRSCLFRNLLTTSAPNVNDTPRSFSPQPCTSLSGSDHSRSHSSPVNSHHTVHIPASIFSHFEFVIFIFRWLITSSSHIILGLLTTEKAFYVEETGQMVSKHINGHRSTCTVVNSDLPVPIYTQSHQLPFYAGVLSHDAIFTAVFTYIYSLLIKKDICDYRNVSINLSCVCVCLSPGDVFIFSVRVASSFSCFLCHPYCIVLKGGHFCQCTATFSRSIVLPRILGITRT